LKLGAVGAVYLIARPYMRILDGLYQSNSNSDEFEQNIGEAVGFIKNNYSVDIFTGMPNVSGFFNLISGIKGTDLSRFELSRGLGLVMEEIVKYPPRYFTDNGVHNIRFLNNVKVRGIDYYGGFGANQGTLGIAYSAANNEADREYERDVFHHELYHGTDWHDGLYLFDDNRWRDLHNCGCRPYWERGGRDSLEGAEPPQSSPNWFLDPYGQTEAPEDRAVFASHVMIPRLHRNLLTLINTSSNQTTRNILQRKYDAIKKDFAKWSGGKMNDQYWKDLVDDRVSWGYFGNT